MQKIIILVLLIFIVHTSWADELVVETDSAIDYAAFLKLSGEVEPYREKRLLDLDTFLEMAADKNTIILDTRSESEYKSKHIKGAKHLNFSDFSDEKLAKLIPDNNTRILIYCNNNLYGDPVHFTRKAISLALNVPTFINLYGYGYKNIYELGVDISVTDPRLDFSGTWRPLVK